MKLNKIRSIVVLIIFLLSLFTFGACNTNESKDDLVWTNDNAIYAYVKTGCENEILKDVEGAFQSLRFKKVYITEKSTSSPPLVLLFILENSETESKQEFINLLKNDKRINYVRNCRDQYFETVDNRYIEREKDTISVGELMSVTLTGGSVDIYIQPFDFCGVRVKPKTMKDYAVQDFPEINLKSVIKQDNGWLSLELMEENYFDVIKALDKLSRLNDFEEIKPAINYYSPLPPPTWLVSDSTIVKLETNPENYGTAVITGLKPGKVVVEFAYIGSVRCEITVV